VRQQVALRFWKVVEEIGALRACSESSGVMKEFEDLLEDEEEDVVCAALDSSLKIIANLAKAFHMQPKTLERQIAPIYAKILTLI
jgi:hypothetical protein